MNTRYRDSLIAILLLLHSGSHVRAQQLQWVRQQGSVGLDSSSGVCVDALGNVYISGGTQQGSDPKNAITLDAFVTKYDPLGNLEWTQRIGTPTYDVATGIAASPSGSVFVTGNTLGDLAAANTGSYDMFVSKYDTSGSLQWTRQLGADSEVLSGGISTDNQGNVYIAGETEGSLGAANAGIGDAFLTKYDESGSLKWTRQWGTASHDGANGISTDRLGNVFVTGFSWGSLGGPNAGAIDAFVSKFDTSGDLKWTRQLGTSNWDNSRGVATDSLGNVYITGDTWGSLGGSNAGNSDVFLSKYDSTGVLQWTRQFGASGSEAGYSISLDSLNNIYVTGGVSAVGRGPDQGSDDAFISKFDSSGNLQWTRIFGSSSDDAGSGVAADAFGNVYSSGYTFGSLAAANAGVDDAFIAKFSSVPEPRALLLGLLLGIPVMLLRNRREQNLAIG